MLVEQRSEHVEGAFLLTLGRTRKLEDALPDAADVVLLDAAALAATYPVGSNEPATGPFGRTLRIALAMKGGVSLAVWIGGAVAELDVLRRIRLIGEPANPRAVLLATWARGQEKQVAIAQLQLIERATVYAELLASRGYDEVEFDVLAGASAGGLNAVMYGVAQRVGVTTDKILEVWQESGDIWNLFRGRGVKSIDSVLRGDEYFWGAMQGALRDLYDAPHHSALVAPVSVDLSATVIDGEESSERGTREGKAHFHFSGGTDTCMPGRLIPDHETNRKDANAALERLAYAARTTSSFPGAFEPAKIYSGVAAAELGSVDMREAFHAHRKTRVTQPDGTHLDPFRVVDGGVTDNVPIDRALRAIRHRPADRYVNRALVYLDPSPKLEFDGLIRPTAYAGRPPSLQENGSEINVPDPRSSFLAVIFTALGHMLGRESKDDEVEGVERFRRTLFLEQGKDELFAPITEEPISRTGGGNPVHVSRAYARFRSVADLDLLTEVLVQPSLWQLTSKSPRAEHRGWSREDLGGLEPIFLDHIGRNLDAGQLEGVCTGFQAAVDACRCMISWIRAIEDGAFWSGGGIANLDGTVWAASGAARVRRALRAKLHDQLGAALIDRDEAIMQVLKGADSCAPPLGDQILPRFLAEKVVEAWLKYGNAIPSDASRWDTLDSLLEDLRAVSLALDDHEGNSPTAVEERGDRLRTTDWAQSPWSGIGRTPSSFKARDLAPLVAARGMPMAMPAMRYEDITAAETRRDPGAYRALMEAQMINGYRSLLKLSLKDAKQLAPEGTGTEEAALPVGVQTESVSESVRRLMPTDEISPRTKLAGMGLANFAGFLSGDWRTNDWWWGRLDAAQGAINVLESLNPVEDSPCSARPCPRQDAETAVLDEWRLTGGGNVPKGREEFQSSIGANIAGLASLEPSYRVAVTSRLIRLASRAIVRGSSKFAPQRISLWLLRPLLVFMPALLDPPRIAIVFALIVMPLLVAVPGGQSNDLGGWIAALALAIFSVATVIISFTERLRRTHALAAAIDTTRMKCVRDAIQRAGWVGAGYALAALITAAGALWILATTEKQQPLVWVMLGAALILSLFARSRFLVPMVPSGHSPVRSIVGVLVAIAIVAVAWLFSWMSNGSEGEMEYWFLALLASATGTSVALALMLGWLTGLEKQACGKRQSRFPRLIGLGVLTFTAVLCGIVSGSPFIVPLLSQQDWVSPAIPALIAFWAWGTALWWMPAWLQPEYAPSDTTATRKPPRERQINVAITSDL